ncbi:hypothetical protein AKJ37_02880 [candidate division MSBL1 archaeon SCGC-AAA259I09]|uniref:Single-stranded DNA binding protein Ssb-like OB fold domain-containing protein n=2 Tax=candidate division MSBL1 TaxID=215777 RepID=A0A133UTR6_9EURY|nr:hypothetical protein AKJ37_02880 [candidate division MSBL1 archaeon SCGC-AAA259I09]KXA98794.1 hypothetical protein AKJ39_00710 [candidate division MSBL1 archaeon SCGC-AAA259J03]
MKASEVKPGMRNLNLNLKVINIGDINSFKNEKGEGRVATAICEDDSGKVKVSLWNEEIDKVDKGDRIRIESGYSRLFKDEVHISAGKYGELKVLKDS